MYEVVLNIDLVKYSHEIYNQIPSLKIRITNSNIEKITTMLQKTWDNAR